MGSLEDVKFKIVEAIASHDAGKENRNKCNYRNVKGKERKDS